MPSPLTVRAPAGAKGRGSLLFAAWAGAFFFVALLKFGDPVVLDKYMEAPEGFLHAVYDPWPLRWGCWMAMVFVGVGLLACHWRAARGFALPLVLMAAWLGWQFVSSTQTCEPALTAVTLKHFTVCAALFYLGRLAMRFDRHAWPFWAALALALCWIIHTGFEQHFGGLEAAEKMLRSAKPPPGIPQQALDDPNYAKRIAGRRIFGTFSNPDALAGGLELLLPASLLFLWKITPKVRPFMRWGFVVILGGCGLACMFWTGSKAGWLITLGMGLAALSASPISKKWKRGLIVGILGLGLIGFAVRNSAYFHRGYNSMDARFAYWRAALKIAEVHPLLGTGPGTFSVPFGNMKRAEDEMARLCHNDYLEQASDSGFFGFFAYFALFAAVFFSLYRYRKSKNLSGFDLQFMVILGTVALAVHSAVDFHLYTPALSWPMFFLLGSSENFEV